jgi:hypothetical protein
MDLNPYQITGKQLEEERERRQKERDEYARENLKESRDLRIKSLTHWAVLSGGTLTLLMPFVQTLDKPFVAIKILLIAVVFLIFALLVNSLGPFVTSTQRYNFFRYLSGDKDYNWFWNPINHWIHPVGIFSYIFGVIATTVFIGLNLV